MNLILLFFVCNVCVQVVVGGRERERLVSLGERENGVVGENEREGRVFIWERVEPTGLDY